MKITFEKSSGIITSLKYCQYVVHDHFMKSLRMFQVHGPSVTAAFRTIMRAFKSAGMMVFWMTVSPNVGSVCKMITGVVLSPAPTLPPD